MIINCFYEIVFLRSQLTKFLQAFIYLFIRDIIEADVLPEHQCYFAGNGPFDRTITEFCCGPNSRIGRNYKCSEGCRVIRITEGLDANSVEGKFIAAKGAAARNLTLAGGARDRVIALLNGRRY